MESQLKTQKQSSKGSVAIMALFRLALLVGPETVVLKTMGHSPIVCLVAAVAVLGVWLSVDIGPFRAATVKAEVRPRTVPANPGYAQNLTKAQWWSYLFCRMILFVLMFHSKLTI